MSDNYVDLSDVYVNLSDNYVDLSDVYVNLSDNYVDLSDVMSTCQKNMLSTGCVNWAWKHFYDEFLNKWISDKSTKRSDKST